MDNMTKRIAYSELSLELKKDMAQPSWHERSQSPENGAPPN
jgi:hypothetical protein